MQQTPSTTSEKPELTPMPFADRLLLIGGLAVVAAFVVLTPGSLLDKADHVGYAVCHQIPVRSFFFDGRQLPLCARCSGQYLGALFGLGVLVVLGRGRAGLLPPLSVVFILLGFLALWAFDGLNSYLTLFGGLPHLYEPSNLLRATTGAMQGVALITLTLPFFNGTLWARPAMRRTIANAREVLLLLVVIAGIVLLLTSEQPSLLYPLALASVAGTLMMLALVNTMLVTLLLRRDGQAQSWRTAAPLLAAGLALGTIELLALNLVRAWLTTALNLPF